MEQSNRSCLTQDHCEEKDDAFKKEFKRFRRPSPEDMKQVIDFNQPERFKSEVTVFDKHSISIGEESTELGLHSIKTWKIFTLKLVPGLIVIENPFQNGYQHRWVHQCLVNYPCLPNITNLDAHITRTGSGQIWPPLEECTTGAIVGRDSLLQKLRWVTLGYHYDWNTKLYYKQNHSPFPDDLSRLTQCILRVLGFPLFRAEAAIVNYYHLDSTLSGHTDHSERDLTAPLISISFGQSAIFLIGGCTKQDKPLPLLIRSGDIVIMSGESRLAYHGVPKILTPEVDVIPSCLSRTVLESALSLKKQSLLIDDCPLCGSNTKTSIKPSRTSNNDTTIISGIKRTRKDHLGESRKPKRKSMENSESETYELELEDGTEITCDGCQWLLENWVHFETYLSNSRINLNVRQVGEI